MVRCRVITLAGDTSCPHGSYIVAVTVYYLFRRCPGPCCREGAVTSPDS
jgi:hypothetical protein